ncbi:MAG TPA: hypothetical protein VIY71_00945, partial [Solirubrobacterales bacterium]
MSGSGLGELALRLRRFLPRPPTVGTASPTRLAATRSALRHPLFLAPLGLGLAALAMLEPGGALLIARLLSLLLRV